jgi:hypothetical protein
MRLGATFAFCMPGRLPHHYTYYDMDQNEYKIKINDPCAFRENILRETLKILKAHSAAEPSIFEEAYNSAGIQKPSMHQHPEASKYAQLVDIWTNFRDWIQRGGQV